MFRSDGTLYFTDPPYGLVKQDEDPAKELTFNGVFKYSNGKLEAIIRDLTRPNGVALSPDEKTLYVANPDPARKVVMRYDVAPDGRVSNGRVFVDLTAETAAGLPDPPQGRRARQRTPRAQWRAGARARRHPARGDCDAGNARQLRLG